MPDQVHDATKVASHVVNPRTAFTKVVPNMMRAVGSKVKEMGLVSKSVETTASSAG